MLVTLTIDPTDARDIVMRDEINGWLHHSPLRGAWTMIETEIEADDDADGSVMLAYNFDHALDAHTFCHWRGLQGRGRLN
jgi:hypothetical protein